MRTTLTAARTASQRIATHHNTTQLIRWAARSITKTKSVCTMFFKKINPVAFPVKVQEGVLQEVRTESPTNNEKELMIMYAEMHQSTRIELVAFIGIILLLICGFFAAIKFT
uniref:Uncharacterized protein n=1 Tax=Caenorhabditis japonica TaxID=281687 RepID=A0A8R1HLU9_CAEJA